MDCDKCEGKGYIKSSYDYLDKAYYAPCNKCENKCGKCNNTGWCESDTTDKEVPCSACWTWETCENCGGAGEFDQERYHPKVGGIVSEGYVCQKCNGQGTVCIGWGRNDSEIPDKKPSGYVDINI